MAWGQGLSAFGGAVINWGSILYNNARADAELQRREDAAAEAYGKLLQEPGSSELGDAPEVFGPPEPPIQGPPEAGQENMVRGPQLKGDPVAALQRQILEGEAILAAKAPDLIDDYRKAAAGRLRQAELERDSRLLAPTLSRTRAMLGADNKAAEEQLNILIEGLRRGDLTYTQVKAGMKALGQEHTQRLSEAALDAEFEAIVRSLTADPRFNMWGYNSRSHDRASYEAGAYGNVALLGELDRITDDMSPAQRNQFYRAIIGAETQGVAQVLMSTQSENNQLKKEREATRTAIAKVRESQAAGAPPADPGAPGAMNYGPPGSAAGQPSPPAADVPEGQSSAAQPAAAGVPWKQWAAQDHFKGSGVNASHDNAMYLASAQSELADAIAGIGMEGSEQERAAKVAQVLQSWSSKHGVRFDSPADVDAFLSQELEMPSVEERFARVMADVLRIDSQRDIIERAEQAETAVQAVKDVGDRLVAGMVGRYGEWTGDPEFQEYARQRMAEKDTVRQLYDSAAKAVRDAGEQGALAAADWYMRDKNALRTVVDDLSDYIDDVASSYAHWARSSTTAGVVQRRLAAEQNARRRAEREAARRRAAEREGTPSSAELRKNLAAAEQERDRARLRSKMKEVQRKAQDYADPQLQGPTPEWVERRLSELQVEVQEAAREYRHVGSNRAELGRKLRSFMRMRQKYAALADSGMVDRNVVDALSNEIEQLLKLYRRGPKK